MLVLHNCKNYEVYRENYRDFKIGDLFWFEFLGVTDVQEVTDKNILAEVNGTLEYNDKAAIDMCYNFWKYCRKVINH